MIIKIGSQWISADHVTQVEDDPPESGFPGRANLRVRIYFTSDEYIWSYGIGVEDAVNAINVARFVKAGSP